MEGGLDDEVVNEQRERWCGVCEDGWKGREKEGAGSFSISSLLYSVPI